MRNIVLATMLVVGLNACSKLDEQTTESPSANAAPPAVAEQAPEAAQAPAETPKKSSSAGKRPNILLLVADDLGYADLGVYGGDIDTPNLDSLARAGIQFTNYHVAPTCSPTRSMLFSGTDNHLAGIGNMFETMRPNQKGQPGYEGYLNFRVASLASLLRDANYHTYMSGKWHLGRTEETSPAARGFERSFNLDQGGSGHFNGMGLDIREQQSTFREDGKETIIPDDFYSSDFFTDKILEYIGGRDDEQPFFAYLAFTAPHWPLQATDEQLAKYAGKYDEGYDVAYTKRVQRMRELGLADADGILPTRAANQPAWENLSDEQKKIEARKMELFAAMVDGLDVNVGRVIAKLKKMGEFENTFIIFMSDNGAEIIDHGIFQGFDDFVALCCDNSYENMGKPDSYVYYGPNWARVSNGHLRGAKGFTTEGGIRVPAFVHYPALANNGTRNDAFMSVMDVLPTFLELAGTEHPGTQYQDREVLPLKGESMLAMLDGRATQVHDDQYWMGWELFNRKAIRQGDWKAVNIRMPHGASDWQLYNVANDPSEQHELTEGDAAVKRSELMALWDRYVSENGLIFAPPVIRSGE